jgi:hypothetical protein
LISILKELFFPVRDQLIAEAMFTTNLGGGFFSCENLEDYAGLELRFECAMFLHG